jgi:uncharacterized protein (TIGR00251 family)
MVKVKPGSKKESIGIAADGKITVAVRAQAQEGKANERLVEILADVLNLAKSNVILVKGQQSRFKELSIKGKTDQEILELLQTSSTISHK